MPIKRFLLLLSLVLSAKLSAQSRDTFPRIEPKDIVIARDTWGVAHIFAPRDAQVAYGLAWANAEDAFPQIQEALALAKGRMGRIKGKEGAAYDYFAHALRAEPQVKQDMAKLSPDFAAYLNGYVQGINAYAAAHPEQVLAKGLFPVSMADILKVYLLSFSALTGAADKFQQIMGGQTDTLPRSRPWGSNAYAFAPPMTKDRQTYLAINPHFMIDGPLSFYEAHLQSEEGLNITGALFQGGTCVFMGNNEHLGWGHTFNYLHQVDVFELKMKGKRSRRYRYNGGYRKLETRPVWLKVRLGKIVIPVRRKTYYSVYGPTLKAPSGQYYALRAPAFFESRMGEQFYRMDKARNLAEFKAALDLQRLPLFNIVYADKEANIFYLCNGLFPKRDSACDFRQVVPGDTSATLWPAGEYLPVKALPQVNNPACGWVFNTNNTPASASCPESNFPKAKVSPYMDMRSGENNRSTRFLELIAERAGERWTFEDFKRLKFDTRMSLNSPFIRSLKGLYQLVPEEHPQVEAVLRRIQKWDGDAGPKNTDATLFLITMQYLFEAKGFSDPVFILGVGEIPDSLYLRCIEQAAAWLIEHHGSLHVELQTVMCLWRQGKVLGSVGFPDALCPAYGEPQRNGRYKMNYGDTYIHFVRFSREGPAEIQTLLPFKNTETCELYADELDLFNRQQFKRMSLDKNQILGQALRRYHPVKSKN